MAKATVINGITGEVIGEMETPDVENKDVENSWAALRGKRLMLLVDTDIYALSDMTMTDEMKQYRQQLRDLPANTSDPENPTWPTPPS
tara:strand:+ start:990 stop:1253 length:264 start_codon:yes stop_codon:yes gene_type:complete